MSDPQHSGYSGDPYWQAQPPAQPPAQAGGYPDPGYQPIYQDPNAQGYQPGYSPEAGYPASAYPAGVDPMTGQPLATPGYPPAGYPVASPGPSTNGLAIAAMVVSIIGALGLCAYGQGGYLGIVGAIMGHVARGQIRQRGENGDGFAKAGIIIGWISAALAIIALIALIIFFVWLANTAPYDIDSGY